MENPSSLPEIDVAHICLFEEDTQRVLLQFNERFQKFSFVWWKCDWKDIIKTILDEMGDEIWYILLPKNFTKVDENSKVVWWKMCNWTIFAWFLPKWFEAYDTKWEWEARFYDLDKAPLEDFITWDNKETLIENIKWYRDKLKGKL